MLVSGQALSPTLGGSYAICNLQTRKHGLKNGGGEKGRTKNTCMFAIVLPAFFGGTWEPIWGGAAGGVRERGGVCAWDELLTHSRTAG